MAVVLFLSPGIAFFFFYYSRSLFLYLLRVGQDAFGRAFEQFRLQHSGIARLYVFTRYECADACRMLLARGDKPGERIYLLLQADSLYARGIVAITGDIIFQRG